jgi:Zn ribbon nucleic-acid-binding protein
MYQPLDQPYELSAEQSTKWKHYREADKKYKQSCLLSVVLIKESIDQVIWLNLQNLFPDETNIRENKNDQDVQTLFNYLNNLYGTGSTIKNQKSENAISKLPMFNDFMTAERALLSYQNLTKERNSWGISYQHSDTTKISWLQTRVHTPDFEKILLLIEDNPHHNFNYFLSATNNHILNLRRRLSIKEEETMLKMNINNPDISINATVNTQDQINNTVNKNVQCYNCGQTGHYKSQCPKLTDTRINPNSSYTFVPKGSPIRS